MSPDNNQTAATNAALPAGILDAEAQLAVTIRCMHLGYIVWDAGLCVVDWNPAAERIFGWTLSEARGKHASILMPSLAADSAPDLLQNVLLQNGDSGAVVITCVARDDAVLVCDWHTTALRSAAGVVVGFLSMVQDITSREKAERELRKSSTFLQTIIDTEPECVKLVARDCTLLMMNRAGLDMIQAESLAQVKGCPLAPLIAPDHRTPFAAVVDSVFQGKSEKIEFEMVGLKGKRLWLESHAVPLRNEKNEIIAALAITRDVTKSRQAAGELKQERDFIAAILNIVGAMVLVLDRTGRIIRFNRTCEEVSGYTAAEALGRYVWDFLIPAEQIPGVKHTFADLAAGMFPSRYENSWIAKDGKRKLIAWSNTALLDATGAVEYVIPTGIDLSERSKLEEQLRHAQKMESIGTLAGGIAHDFNNILTAITGYGSLLRARIGQTDPLSGYVEQIMAAASRAAMLTQSLLAYNGKQLLHPVPVNLNEIVTRIGRLLNRLIGEDLELKMLLSEQDLTVLADAGQIEQVLMNIATNAREAMARGGYLFLETARENLDQESAAQCDIEKAGSYAVITITDTGTGMDEATRARVFEPFFTTKEMGKGTGLGLSIAYGIVKQHNGAIIVSGEPGMGTTFKIYLPMISAADQQYPASELAPITGGTETVLVAEDDDVIRQLTTTILEQYGYRVIQARDGEEAVNKCMEHADQVKLLLLDAIMPKKTGREAYDKIRIFHPAIRALFLSGYTTNIMQEKGLLEPGMQVIMKPITMDDLLRKVRAALDSTSE